MPPPRRRYGRSVTFEPLHLTYRLTRRQQLASHLGIWLRFWPAFVVVLLSLVGTLALAARGSWWFLLLLCLPLPPFNNIPRLLGGVIGPLLWGRRTLDLVLEPARLGYLDGADRAWMDLSTVDGVHRFRADTWTISFTDGPHITVPVSAIDLRYIEHVRSMAGGAPPR